MSLRPRSSASSSQPSPLEGKLTVNEVRQMLDANKARTSPPQPELSHADMARILRQAGYIVVEPVRVARK